jgi:hypothetical protein
MWYFKVNEFPQEGSIESVWRHDAVSVEAALMFPLHSFLTCRSGFDSMVFVTAIAPRIVNDVERMLRSQLAAIIPQTALGTQSYDRQLTLSGVRSNRPAKGYECNPDLSTARYKALARP